MKKVALILVLITMVSIALPALAFTNPLIAINNYDVVIKSNVDHKTGETVIKKAIIPTLKGFDIILFPFTEGNVYIIIQHNFLCNITDITCYSFP